MALFGKLQPAAVETRLFGLTALAIPPRVVGGNVFGSTVEEAESFRLLDARGEYGLTATDMTDFYSA